MEAIGGSLGDLDESGQGFVTLIINLTPTDDQTVRRCCLI
jgi:hypothetical protein